MPMEILDDLKLHVGDDRKFVRQVADAIRLFSVGRCLISWMKLMLGMEGGWIK